MIRAVVAGRPRHRWLLSLGLGLWGVVLGEVPVARAGDFAAIPWGQPETVVREQIGADACVAGRVPAERVCSASWPIAGEPGRAYFWLVGNRLVQVNLVVPSRSFQALARALQAWLGGAFAVRQERVTQGAITFSNEIREWRTPRVAAVVSKYEVGYGSATQASLRLLAEPGPSVGLWTAPRTP